MIHVHLLGPHVRRTPLSYAALRPLLASRVHVTGLPGGDEAPPAAADLVAFAHPRDIAELTAPMRAAIGDRPVVLLSEEPFWDTMFSPDPLARHVTVDTAAGPLPVRQINHHTSAIYRFVHLPYFVLTDHHYLAAYTARFRRNARRTPAEWRGDFAARLPLAFMAERRPEAFHDVRFAAGDITGLCAWRTRLAEAVPEAIGQRLGASWQGGARRHDMAHWHLDKMVRMDGAVRVFSAIENTHQPDYLSEKPFDAFACGALPAYVASRGHGVHRLGLPPPAWVNLHGLTPEAAAAHLIAVATDPDAVDFGAFAQAQSLLSARVTDMDAIVAERMRIADAVVAELCDAL